jgi:hypothetical protein
LNETIASGDAAAIVRVGIAAEQKLERLAKVEQRSNVDNGPSFKAFVAVRNQLAKWRDANAVTSPDARRENIHRHHAARVRTVQQQIEHAAELFGLSEAVTRTKRTERADALKTTQPEPKIVVGRAWQ